ncbi:MAG: DUF58 domain-containing protein [Acidimicrobiales bacterium]
MPTRRGWQAVVTALALLVGGRVFGIVELDILAAATAALLIGGLVQVRRRRPRLDAHRAMTPTRLFCGDSVEVEVTLANLARRNTPVLMATDAVGRRRDPVKVPMGWIEAGGQAGFSYRFGCEERGRHPLGPIQIEAEDAFGLARARVTCGDPAELLVYPSIEALVPPPPGGAEDSRGGPERPRSIPGSGGDFYALRPYEVGDDLRRVHWPSVARTGELMIRREETDQHRRVTVALDLRRAVHSPDTLEAAAAAAASVIAATGTNTLRRLITGDGFDTGYGTGLDHGEAVLLHLAIVNRVSDPTPARLITALGTRAASGTLVVITATPCPQIDLMTMAGMTRWYTDVTLVLVQRPGWDPAAYGYPIGDPPVPSGVRTISFVAGQALKPAWDKAMDRAASRLATS